MNIFNWEPFFKLLINKKNNQKYYYEIKKYNNNVTLTNINRIKNEKIYKFYKKLNTIWKFIIHIYLMVVVEFINFHIYIKTKANNFYEYWINFYFSYMKGEVKNYLIWHNIPMQNIMLSCKNMY